MLRRSPSLTAIQDMSLRDLMTEMKRRRVFKVTGIYVVAMFATLQGAQVLVSSLALPAWTMTLLTLLALFMFPVVVILAWVFDVTPDGLQRAPVASSSRAVGYVGLGIVIALVAFGAYAVVDARPETPTETKTSGTSIAVLPFVNMSAEAEQEYFSDGLTEELLNALAQVPELRVAARTSSFSFKGKNVPVAEIAQALNVSTVLEGSVRKAGNRVRITAQLIDAVQGHHLWSQIYDRELTDIFAIQEEISRSITDALKIRLGARTSEALATPATENLEAYNHYLQARHFWNKRSAEGILRARELLERAIELDPQYARAHAALADVYVIATEYADLPIAEAQRKGRAAAQRAIALDSTLAEPHAALGMLAIGVFEWDASVAALERAIALNPNYATAHQWYSWILHYTGKADEGLRETRKALELDPLSQVINGSLGEHLILLRRYDEAERQLQRLIEIDPTFTLVLNDFAWLFLAKGDIPKARSYAERLVAMPGLRSGYELGTAAAVFARAGEPRRAREILAEMETRKLWSTMGFAYAGMGEADLALTAFEKALDAGDPTVVGIATTDPLIDALRPHPRFQALLRRIGR